MHSKLIAKLLFLFIFLSPVSRLALGQVETGSIAGTVTDPSGAAVAGAVITAKNLATNGERSTPSSATGTYAIVGLAPATYEITATARSFKPYLTKLEVTVGGHVSLDVKLSISASTTNVEVIAHEGGIGVNARTQELSQVVDTQQLAQLPSLTRNPYDFIAVSGNVNNGDNTTTNSNSGQNLGGRGVGYAINGQRESGVEILLVDCNN